MRSYPLTKRKDTIYNVREKLPKPKPSNTHQRIIVLFSRVRSVPRDPRFPRGHNRGGSRVQLSEYAEPEETWSGLRARSHVYGKRMERGCLARLTSGNIINARVRTRVFRPGCVWRSAPRCLPHRSSWSLLAPPRRPPSYHFFFSSSSFFPADSERPLSVQCTVAVGSQGRVAWEGSQSLKVRN